MADESWDDIVTEAENSGFGEPAPLGKYEVKIISAEAGESSTKKTPEIALKLKITKGEHAGKSPTTYPHKFWKTQKAAWSVTGNCNAVGISNDTLRAHKPTLAQIAAVMVGKVVNVTTTYEIDKDTKEPVVLRNGDNKIVVRGTMNAPDGGANPVTAFPPVPQIHTPVVGGVSASAGPAPF